MYGRDKKVDVGYASRESTVSPQSSLQVESDEDHGLEGDARVARWEAHAGLRDCVLGEIARAIVLRDISVGAVTVFQDVSSRIGENGDADSEKVRSKSASY